MTGLDFWGIYFWEDLLVLFCGSFVFVFWGCVEDLLEMTGIPQWLGQPLLKKRKEI